MNNLKTVLCAAFVACGSLQASGWGESFATASKEFPVVVPALALGGIVVAEKLVKTANPVSDTLAGHLHNKPVATVLVGLLAGQLILKNFFPKLMKQLIIAPAKKNPILTAALCGAFFCGPKLLNMISTKKLSSEKSTSN